MATPADKAKITKARNAKATQIATVTSIQTQIKSIIADDDADDKLVKALLEDHRQAANDFQRAAAALHALLEPPEKDTDEAGTTKTNLEYRKFQLQYEELYEARLTADPQHVAEEDAAAKKAEAISAMNDLDKKYGKLAGQRTSLKTTLDELQIKVSHLLWTTVVRSLDEQKQQLELGIPPHVDKIRSLHQETYKKALEKFEAARETFSADRNTILIKLASMEKEEGVGGMVTSTPNSSFVGHNDMSELLEGLHSTIKKIAEKESSAKSNSKYAYKKADYPKFDGQTQRFPDFYKEWKTEIRPQLSDLQFCRMLDDHTPADFSLDGIDDPDVALDRLWLRYFNPGAASTGLTEKFLEMKQLKGDNEDAQLCNLYEVLMKLHTSMKALGLQGQVEDSMIVFNHVMKLMPQVFLIKFSEVQVQLNRDAKRGLTGMDASMAQPPTKTIFTKLLEWLKEQQEMIYTTRSFNINKKPAKRQFNAFALPVKPTKPEDNGGGRGDKNEEKPEKGDKGLAKKDPLRKKQLEAGACPVCGWYHTWRGKQANARVNPSTCLADCPQYRKLTADQKAQKCLELKACLKCSDWKHVTANCTRPNFSCNVMVGNDKCGKKHHRMLHESTNAQVLQVNSTAINLQGRAILLHMVSVRINGRVQTTVFMDSGSTTSLITHSLAQALKLPSRATTEWVELTNKEPEEWRTRIYTLEWKLSTGEVKTLELLGVDKITRNTYVSDVSAAYEVFPHLAPGSVDRPVHPVGILLGQDYASLLPTGGEGKDQVGDLSVMHCKFGQGLVLGGHHPDIIAEDVEYAEAANALRNLRRKRTLQVNKLYKLPTSPMEALSEELPEAVFQERFFQGEAAGINVKARCASCRGCNQCVIKDSSRTVKEQLELEMCEKSLKYDEEAKRVRITYPLVGDLSRFRWNLEQAIKLAENNWRTIKRKGYLPQYQELYRDFQKRGIWRKLSKAEIEKARAEGKLCNFISHHAVMNDHSKSTPIRIVTNAALRNSWTGPSLNDIYVKGPNSLNSLVDVLLNFRTDLEALIFDISKAYHQLLTGEDEMFQRLLVWRDDEDSEWEILGTCAMTFGDKPASLFLELAKKLAAEMGTKIDANAALKILVGSYVDDGLIPDTKEAIDKMIGTVTKTEDGKLVYSGTISQILALVGFSPKMIVRSGETDPEILSKVGKTLGIRWSPDTDMFEFDFPVNMSKRQGAAKLGPDWTADDVPTIDSFVFTRRSALTLVAQLYDPLGLLTAFSIQLKLAMKETVLLENKAWDDPLPQEMQLRWRELAKTMVLAKPVMFQRCIKPLNAKPKMEIIGFWDGSSVAFAGVVYARWQDTAGQWKISLLCSKSRVTPKAGLTIPRAELSGLVVLVRLIDVVVKAFAQLFIVPQRVSLMGDSTCTVAATDINANALQTYFSNRVTEILSTMAEWGSKSKVDMKQELEEPQDTCQVDLIYHIPGDQNVADLPTRVNTAIDQMGPDSLWQTGPAFLKQSRDTWPVTRDCVKKVPDEEIRRKYVSLTNSLKLGRKDGYAADLTKIMSSTTSHDKARGIIARIVKAWRTKRREAIAEELTAEDYVQADYLMNIMAMSTTKQLVQQGHASSLLPFWERGLCWTRGRLSAKAWKTSTTHDKLLLLSAKHPLAKLVLTKAHRADHRLSHMDALTRTRAQGYWILDGPRLAKKVIKDCQHCHIMKKLAETVNQRMGKLPDEIAETNVSPFTVICLDFLAPMLVKSQVKAVRRGGRRATMTKVYPIVAVCFHTGALHVLLSTDYSTDALMTQLEELFAIRGVPQKIITDLGTQLVKAGAISQAVEDAMVIPFDQLKTRTAVRNIVWIHAPSGCQFRNGKAEAMVKAFKHSLALLLTPGEELTYPELRTHCARASSVINDRPLGVVATNQQEPDVRVLTPNTLLQGSRTQPVHVDLNRFDEDNSIYTKRMKHQDHVFKLWWRDWISQYFPTVVPVAKWRTVVRNPAIGDIVAVKPTGSDFSVAKFRYAEVIGVKEDLDGLVRTVVVQYRRRDRRDNGKLYVAKELVAQELAIQRIAVIMPAEDRPK